MMQSKSRLESLKINVSSLLTIQFLHGAYHQGKPIPRSRLSKEHVGRKPLRDPGDDLILLKTGTEHVTRAMACLSALVLPNVVCISADWRIERVTVDCRPCMIEDRACPPMRSLELLAKIIYMKAVLANSSSDTLWRGCRMREHSSTWSAYNGSADSPAPMPSSSICYLFLLHLLRRDNGLVVESFVRATCLF